MLDSANVQIRKDGRRCLGRYSHLSEPFRLKWRGWSAAHWTHGVAWISLGLAEPQTRVRIAVGPLMIPGSVPVREI